MIFLHSSTSDLQISLRSELSFDSEEARLASLLMESKEYSEALSVLSGLIKEVRRLVDKLLLVDIDLMRVSSISL
ncbi:non-ATPase subunit 9 [Prunus dulcis]|uniref:Non-ATPase subunit 9 n=1 Tax=Prunus dulcis TaxID=3755 RepID=A0A4Y1RR93_PRUDU|nr:non-ATPase subunit 9 [Prunus dulcis]